MANFTEKNTTKMFLKTKSYTPQEIEAKVNDPLFIYDKTDIALGRHFELHRLIHYKDTFTLIDLVDTWYSFCEDDVSRELNETCQLIASFFSSADEYMNWYDIDRPVETINLGEAIITESKNPFTKTELKYIVDYFNNKIKTGEQSKAELYTKIKEEWLQFYLNQEV